MELKPGFKLSEAGPIPEDWDAEKLGDHLEFKNGISKAGHYFGHGTPIVNYMDVFRSPCLSLNHLRGRVAVTPDEAKRFSVRRGDAFFTRTSETAEEIGMSAVALDDRPNVVFSGFVLRGRPKTERLRPEFLAYALRTPPVRQQIASRATYTTRALTNGGMLSLTGVAAPCPDEQIAIARTLSNLDAWITSAEAEAAKLASVKAAAMDALLTPTTRLPDFSGEWVRQSLRQLGTTLGGLTGKAASDFGQGDDRYVSFNSVMADIVLREADLQPVRIGPKERQTRVQTGDLVFTGSSETPDEVGTCSLVPDGFPSAAVNSFCFVLRARTPSSFHPFFLAAVMRFGEGRSLLQGIGQGGIRYNLSKASFLELQVSVPPTLAEQQAIGAVLSDIDAALAAARAVVAKARSVKAAAMDALLSGRVRLPGFGPTERRASADALEAA